ncbi:MAG TPA: carboxypeptidase-like regulatory domain-containing protein, partial [Polyangia bacterium]|nr:carboxypeptidase-like regulatory domain-containing protein [Polyangia bacterium]
RAWPLGAGGVVGDAAPRTAPLASSLTDAGGHFALPRVPRAPLLLEVEHPSYPTTLASAEAGAGATAQLTVPIPGGIDGELHEHVTGGAVAGGTVEALGPGGQRATAAAKRGTGAFRLPRLRPGHWTLTARARGYATAIRDVDVPESPSLGDASVRGLRLELDQER